jgi:hypothetical protein
MKATVSPIAQRIALKLDLGMAFEALILNRLARLPDTRRQEWLRGLLVQGFQRECRALRKLQRAGQSGANEARTQNVAAHQSVSAVSHQSPMPQQKTTPQTAPAAINAQHSNDKVSFAALRKVIG